MIDLNDTEEVFDALVQKDRYTWLATRTEILTLGELIAYLSAQPGSNIVKIERGGLLYNPGSLDSYRGYYEDLFIDYYGGNDDVVTVDSLLAELRSAIGATFTGYKGGDFTMSRRTPVWVDQYGYCDGTGVTGVVERDGVTVITSADCDSI